MLASSLMINLIVDSKHSLKFKTSAAKPDPLTT